MNSTMRSYGPAGWMLAFIAALMAGCAGAGLGRVRPSADVVRQFQDLEINPNFRYWTLNQENNPYGVLGIDREYNLSGGHVWAELDPDAPAYKKVVGLVQSFPALGGVTAGFEILDARGRRIGVWYSSLTAGITVDDGAKTVSVSTSIPWRRP